MSEVKVKFLRPVTISRTSHPVGAIDHITEEMAKSLSAIKNPPVIEVLSNVDWATKAQTVTPTKPAEPAPVDADFQITEEIQIVLDELALIDGVGPDLAEEMYKSGFTSLESVQQSTVKALKAVKGIGKASAEKILADAQELVIKE